MVVAFLELKCPVREYMAFMTHLDGSLDGYQGFYAVRLGKTEIPTYLQSHTSTFFADINAYGGSHLELRHERVVILFVSHRCLGTVPGQQQGAG